jgi:Ca2+-binding RTX toxin-like protein
LAMAARPSPTRAVTETSVTGGAGADSITGSAGGDQLSGAGGGDQLTGGAGDDRLEGGAATMWSRRNDTDTVVWSGDLADFYGRL